jgi:hypothetical protein
MDGMLGGRMVWVECHVVGLWVDVMSRHPNLQDFATINFAKELLIDTTFDLS